MEVFSGTAETMRGPADWFSGTVWVDNVVTPESPVALRVARVSFEPGARTVWHTHPRGQAIFVLSGVCQAQARGGPVQELTAGQAAFFAPGEVHWHGAKAGHATVHLAMQQPDESGSVVTWLEQVAEMADSGQ